MTNKTDSVAGRQETEILLRNFSCCESFWSSSFGAPTSSTLLPVWSSFTTGRFISIPFLFSFPCSCLYFFFFSSHSPIAMSNPLPTIPPAPANPAVLRVDAPASTWDRISSWVSENKAVVYTIAGVAVVVTGAGVVYYLNSDSVRNLAHFSMLSGDGAAQLPPVQGGKKKETS